MKNLTAKQLQRMEKKKKKMAALLEITKLNDKDREAKLFALKKATEEAEKSSDTDISQLSIEENSTRKRPCSEDVKEAPVEDSTIKVEVKTVENTSNSLANKKPRLSGDEYIKLKQELRERKRQYKVIPRFRLKAVGESASLCINIKSENRIPIFLSDVQHLLLYSLHGHHSPYMPTRWCHLEKYNKVTHTVVLVVEGLSLYHFMAYESMFPHITTKLEHRVEVVTPAAYGGSVVEDLAAVPITGIQSDNLIKQYGSLEAALKSTEDVIKLLKTVFPMNCIESTDSSKNESDLPPTDRFARTSLLLSLCQMVEENYPVPLRGELAKKYENYIMTKDSYLEASPRSPMFALDCEMCRTTTGELELTRISIVDESLNIIYDTLVIPENPITDYLTRFSGITKEMLTDVSTTLPDVQQVLRNLLPADAILTGQSLNSDLHTLKMMHPYIIDTSVIFNITGDRYRKTKLQTLVREFLGERIQEHESGHCSTEDSKAAMKLTKLKLANSIDYGDAVLLGRCDMDILKMEVDRRKNVNRKTEIRRYATSLFKHVTKNQKTAAIVGNGEVMNEYSKYMSSSLNVMDDNSFNKNDQVRLVVVDDNKQAVIRASQIAMEHAFTLCHVRVEEDKLKDDQLDKTFRRVNKWVKMLWQHTAINGLACIIFAGQSNKANGACFLNIKREISENCVTRI
ncbi:RNA exonuclease 5 isoform X1 [Augochlora pura]